MATILVVEDEGASRELYREVLTGEGHEVVTAENGQEALQALGTADIDLILLDMRMPGMHGLQVLTELRKREDETPVIICTAVTKLDKAFEVQTHPSSVDFVTKPVDLDDLKAKVAKALEKT